MAYTSEPFTWPIADRAGSGSALVPLVADFAANLPLAGLSDAAASKTGWQAGVRAGAQAGVRARVRAGTPVGVPAADAQAGAAHGG